MTPFPFGLSLSKPCPSFLPFKEERRFDKLSANDLGVSEARHG